ncbi:MAG TPA: cbb3-type cytochrome c oxidase N-terminal domain-containing protein [Rhodocyclaceae bacterium]|nr:cbb3-type cytochrome c oxidase N-terminal domain-containing protein [Rhodocyclaceae bacterium]
MNHHEKRPDQDPLLLDHDADGIRELDNNLPRWWVWLFNLTIIFGVLYLGYYHVFGVGKSSGDEFLTEWRAGEIVKSNSMAKFEVTISALQPSKDDAVVKAGQNTFQTLCAPCHRKDAGGLVGPNLTDDYWIHGSNYADNVKTIWNGVPEKGMITWKGVLKPEDITAVASYIYTLRGTHPPNPKPPENLAPKNTGPSQYE